MSLPNCQRYIFPQLLQPKISLQFQIHREQLVFRNFRRSIENKPQLFPGLCLASGDLCMHPPLLLLLFYVWGPYVAAEQSYTYACRKRNTSRTAIWNVVYRYYTVEPSKLCLLGEKILSCVLHICFPTRQRYTLWQCAKIC